MGATRTADAFRARVDRLTRSRGFERFIVVLVVINAITLGLETDPGLMAAYGRFLLSVDAVILALFVLELGLKLYAQRRPFFANGWNLFDLAVVSVALVPEAGPWSVLRALRVLRVLRMISAVPRLRRVVDSMLRALPGIGAVASLLVLVFYVFGVMATQLFGAAFPDLFGHVGASMYSLFQIMTLESWSMGIVRPVMAVHPWAWAFFLPFILLTTFTVLNLFIAIVVNAVQRDGEAGAVASPPEPEALADQAALMRQMRILESRIDNLSRKLGASPDSQRAA